MFPPQPSQRQLFLDVSAMAEHDLGSGVQRVVRAIGEQLLLHPPRGWRVEPVRARRDGLGYLYARRFTAGLLGLESQPLDDGPLLPRQGDLFLGIDLHHDGVLRQAPYLQLLRAQGVAVYFVVHDLLPCQLPECFPPGAAELHAAWLRVVAAGDGAVGVSRSVAEELEAWIADHPPLEGSEHFRIGWFHHGCDFQPQRNSSVPLAESKPALAPGLTLLMVGTVEPRKGYLDVIEAASLLWHQGLAFNLVIVGREGWTDLPDSKRRNIPTTVEAIRRHPQLGQRLFWFEAASDEQLDLLYRRADGLIGASYGEGFGIPLIEGASYGLPLLLRDLLVFREVSDGAAMFFPPEANPHQLAEAMANFLTRLADPASARSRLAPLKPQTWRQSTNQLLQALGVEPLLQAEALEMESLAQVEASDAPKGSDLDLLGHRLQLRRLFGKLSDEIGEASGWLRDLRARKPSQPGSLVESPLSRPQ
jgi:glycosyltransferase involved in cell wall biosynthesis